MTYRRFGAAVLSLALAACGKSERSALPDSVALTSDTAVGTAQNNTASSNMTFNLTSPAFAPNGSMASKYTCEGRDTSPPLEWSRAPTGARSFALIVEDPDAPDPAKPTRVVSHWVLYNIPAGTTSLAENAAKSGLPAGTAQGSNERKTQTYMGPCPPIGRHRYFFKLSALDTELTGLTNATKADLEKAMQGHVVANAQVIGTYEKAKK